MAQQHAQSARKYFLTQRCMSFGFPDFSFSVAEKMASLRLAMAAAAYLAISVSISWRGPLPAMDGERPWFALVRAAIDRLRSARFFTV